MDQLFDISIINSMIRFVVPILLAALGGSLCARVGLFNIGLEGMMLFGAFGAIVGNYYTGNLFLAVLIAVVTVVIISLLFAFFAVNLQANVIIVGISINFLALGMTTFLLRALFNVKGALHDKSMVGLPKWDIPFLKDLPYVGKIFVGYSPIIYLSFIIVIALYLFYNKTVTGFRLAAIGENKTATRSMGIKVKKLQYVAIILCGVCCGLAGAELSLGSVTMFAEGMTEGRGFIALVAMMLGQSSPIGILGSSMLFGFMEALSHRIQNFSIPTQFTMMIPYIVTIIAMFFFKDKKIMNDSGSSR